MFWTGFAELIEIILLWQGGEEDWLVGSSSEQTDESISTWLRQNISPTTAYLMDKLVMVEVEPLEERSFPRFCAPFRNRSIRERHVKVEKSVLFYRFQPLLLRLIRFITSFYE